MKNIKNNKWFFYLHKRAEQFKNILNTFYKHNQIIDYKCYCYDFNSLRNRAFIKYNFQYELRGNLLLDKTISKFITSIMPLYQNTFIEHLTHDNFYDVTHVMVYFESFMPKDKCFTISFPIDDWKSLALNEDTKFLPVLTK